MELKIKDKKIGDKHPVFIIAELSCNHLQKYDNAVKMIQQAHECGVDAVKLQTFTPDTITLNSDTRHFQIRQGTIWDGTTLYKLYQKAYTPWEWHPKLKKVAEDLGLILFSSPFDQTAVDFLEIMNVPAYKIASFEILDIPLIEYIALKNKPMIISTGVATLDDIKLALSACKRMNNMQVALLKCTSSYPARFEEMNIRVIPDLAKRFKTIVGLSDHTMGISVPVAAVALGARIIEKHFILDRSMGGPDGVFSLEPAEMKALVRNVREAEKALGEVTYKLSPKIEKSKEFARSLFVVKDIRKGDVFTEENVRSIRPGFGLPPKYLPKVLGKKAARDIVFGTPLKKEMVKGWKG
ncbi:MAG: pseudaminic acid synthase [Spirochaetes bacterium]|nr:pseudaminic acid synthase [Spirochaetota bacterium]